MSNYYKLIALAHYGPFRPKGGESVMKVRNYASFVLALKKNSKALVERFAGVLTNNGAEIINTKEWGKRRLAYEINDLREGFYMILNVKSNAH